MDANPILEIGPALLKHEAGSVNERRRVRCSVSEPVALSRAGAPGGGASGAHGRPELTSCQERIGLWEFGRSLSLTYDGIFVFDDIYSFQNQLRDSWLHWTSRRVTELWPRSAGLLVSHSVRASLSECWSRCGL